MLRDFIFTLFSFCFLGVAFACDPVVDPAKPAAARLICRAEHKLYRTKLCLYRPTVRPSTR